MAGDSINLSLHLQRPASGQLFAELSRLLRVDVAAIIRRQAGTMGRYLAENTQPVAGLNAGANLQDLDGGSLKARDLGRAAVRRDIARVYAGPGKSFQILRDEVASQHGRELARAFYALLKQQRIDEARQLLRSAASSVALDVMQWDAGTLHRESRDNRGRVSKSFTPRVVSDGRALKEYIRKIEARVGWAKAAWIRAAGQIEGARGLGKVRGWIKTHTGAPGSGSDRTRNTTSPHVTLTSQVEYADRALPERQYVRAFKQFEEAIGKEIEIAVEALRRRQSQRR